MERGPAGDRTPKPPEGRCISSEARPGTGAGPPIPLFDLRRLHEPSRRELQAAFDRVLDRGGFSSGIEVEALEGALAERIGVAHAVAVGSGTAALFLALVAAGVGPGDEVILPANTFFATAEAVVATGATPVIADVEPATALIDPSSVRALLTARTAAVIAVHLYGQPVDMDRLRVATAGRGLLLLEDAAQAFDGRWGQSMVGSLGGAGAFSFYPTKILGALGEGGAVTTDDEGLARQVRLLRAHGEATKNLHLIVGHNERMDELQAAFLSAKLPLVAGEIDERRALAGRYRRLLAGIDGVKVMHTASDAVEVHHLFVVQVENRDAILAALTAAGIGAGVHYPTPVHLQPALAHLELRAGTAPHAEHLAGSVLSLPLFPGQTEAQVDRCAGALAALVSGR